MKAPRRIALALLGLLLPPTSAALAQPAEPIAPREGGREFWVVFQKNFRDFIVDDRTQEQRPADPLQLGLTITAEHDARGYVEVPGIGFRAEFTVKGGSLVIVPVDTGAQLRSSGRVERLGVHVVADAPVMVYGSNHRFQTTDTYLAYPVELLGRSYRVVGYRWLQNDLLAQMAVVATEDGTRVKISPTAAIATASRSSAPSGKTPAPPADGRLSEVKSERTPPPLDGRVASSTSVRRRIAPEGYEVRVREQEASAPAEMRRPSDPAASTTSFAPAGGVTPVEITLDRGEVYQIIAKYDPKTSSDLTGSLIESDKPVAVFSGHNCAYIPDPTVKACNLLVEQMPPLPAWGREYYVGMLARRSSAVVRVVASEDGTHVIENGREVAVLAAGGYYENRDQRSALAISADHPVLVAQFAKGFDNGDNVGDPMMIIVSPVSQYATAYRFATPLHGSWHNFVSVTLPTASIGDLRLDGDIGLDAATIARFEPIGDGAWSCGAVEIVEGAHTISGSAPFGISGYGFGHDDAAFDGYGNAGGYMIERTAR